MPSNLPARKEETPLTPQEKILKIMTAAVNNQLPGATVTIKDGTVKVSAKTESTVFYAEMRQKGAGLEETRCTFPSRKKGDVSVAEDARILRAEGKTQKEIALLLGRSQAAVSGYLKDA